MTVRIITGDCREALRTLADQSVHCCVTSPPYFGLRDYGVDGQIGLEQTPDAFVSELVAVIREVRRVLRDDGTLWLNLGDSYNAAGREGHGTRVGYKQGTNRASAEKADNCCPSVSSLKEKDLIGIPWRVAFALQADGWYLRQDIIWHKPNPMPESVTDRCTKAHEYLFLLSKSARYHFDNEAIQEPAAGGLPGNVTHKHAAAFDAGDKKHRTKAGLVGYAHRQRARKGAPNGAGDTTRNRRSVWTVPTQPFSGAHFATFPPALIEPCILAGCPDGGTVLDPFGGAGTTGLIADRLQRNAVLIELNPEYADMARNRIRGDASLLAEVE